MLSRKSTKAFLFAAVPTCFSTEICTFMKASIVSASFLGQYAGFSEEKWIIQSDSPYYASLQFDSFDIGCETGSELKVEFTPENIKHYCNTNKPVGRLTSADKYLTVSFRFNKIANSLIEGFSVDYEMLSKDQSVASFISIEDTGKFNSVSFSNFIFIR